MYDELVKDLRYLAKVYSICENENTQEYKLAVKAADAIEELDAKYQMALTDIVRQAKISEVSKELAKNSPKVGNEFGELIPVTERPPEEYETVFLLPMSGEVISGYYDSEHKSYCDMTGFRHLCTHWMPFPEPPKEEA